MYECRRCGAVLDGEEKRLRHRAVMGFGHAAREITAETAERRLKWELEHGDVPGVSRWFRIYVDCGGDEERYVDAVSDVTADMAGREER